MAMDLIQAKDALEKRMHSWLVECGAPQDVKVNISLRPPIDAPISARVAELNLQGPDSTGNVVSQIFSDTEFPEGMAVCLRLERVLVAMMNDALASELEDELGRLRAIIDS